MAKDMLRRLDKTLASFLGTGAAGKRDRLRLAGGCGARSALRPAHVTQGAALPVGRHPGLALGTGAKTAVFSIADAVLPKMLPVREPERLVQFLQPEVLGTTTTTGLSFVNFPEIRAAIPQRGASRRANSL
jgi:hypothetical protein